MNFTSAILTCTRKYVVFSGRATRSDYWWFVLFLLLVGLAAHRIDGVLFGADLTKRYEIDALTYATIRQSGPVEIGFMLLTILPFLSAGWRRMHDTGRSGLFLFMPILVVVGLLVATLVVGGLTSTTDGQQLGAIAAPIFLVALIAAVVSPMLLIWWLSRPSQLGQNQYGPYPHGGAA